jgi:hypothetical protein
LKVSPTNKDDAAAPSFNINVAPSFNIACRTNEFPRLLGRAPMAGAPPAADTTPKHGKPSRRVHFHESEKQLAMNARDAFLARQRLIGTRRS